MLTVIPRSSPEIQPPLSMIAQACSFAGRIVASKPSSGAVSALFGAAVAMIADSPAGLFAAGATFALLLSAKQVVEVNRLEGWHEEASANLIVAGKDIAELSGKNNSLVDQLAAKNTLITEQSTRIEFITGNVRKLVIENRELTEKASDFTSRISDLAAVNSATFEMIEHLRLENTSLKATAASDKDEIAKLRSENEALTTKNQALIAKLKEFASARILELKAKSESYSEQPLDVASASIATTVAEPSSADSSMAASASTASSISIDANDASLDAELAEMMADFDASEAQQ